MKNILVPGIGRCAITLNWFARIPIVVEGCIVIGVNVCAERIVDGGVVREVLSHYMARVQLLVLDWGLIGRAVPPLRLTLALDILHIWIAGAGVGVWVHIGDSEF